MYLDLAELDELFRGRWLWSVRRPAPARFRRADHLGDVQQPLDESVRQLVANSGRHRPQGPIRLLTHLRYFGYVMNPVSFYFCFDGDARSVESVVAEVNNTPWGEQHCYVLDAGQFGSAGGSKGAARAVDKEFHVSPFLPMDLQYDWRVSEPEDALTISLGSHRGNEKLLQVTMRLARQEITTANLARALIRYPLMTHRVVAAIYWQALRLWWKRLPFYVHPGKQKRTPRATSPTTP